MKKSLLFFAGLLILLFTRCTDVDYGTGGGPNSGKSTLSINLSIPGSTINTYSYVDAIGREDEVHTLYALFFQPTTDGSGTFIEAIDISPESGVYKSGQTIELEIPESSTITKNNAYSIFFIANPDYYLDSYGGITRDWSTEVFSGKTENQVMQLRIDIQGNTAAPGSALYYNDRSFYQDNLMMTGNIYKEDGQDMITAELTRIVSRFDIVNEAEGYLLETASIWNAFPEQTIGEINFSDFSTERIKRLYGIEVDDNSVTGGLYTYENFVAVPEQDDEVSTCLILGIRNTKTDNLGYYRVNANLSGRPQQLRRNNVYTFKIKSVTGTGDNSEEDAHNSGKNEINVQINEWNVDDQGCIVFDGDNVLALGTNNVVFNKLGGDVEYRVFTSGEGTLSISDEYIPYGMSYEFKDNMVYLHADPSEVNKGGYIEFQFGKLKATMYITQTGEIDQMLTLSHNMLPMFDFDAGLTSEEVTVTSSGPWTAKIYNDLDAFIFTGHATELTGNDQDKFTITTIDENVDLKPRYAFVHAVLDANPNISAVTIISQNGVNDIILDPEPAQLVFDAEGNQVSASTDYTITVDVGDDAIEWAAEIYGTNKQYFTATVNSTEKTVTVAAVGRNPETIELSTQLRIYLVDNPAIYKEVEILQYVHSLSVTPATVAPVITSGGSSEVFTVTSSADWKAEITSTGNDAYFNNTPNLYIIPDGPDGGGSFYVTFPELNKGGVVPEAIVTVTIPETNFKQIVSVKQTALTGDVINI